MTDAAGLVVFRNAANGPAEPDAREPGQRPDNWPTDYLQARERAERAAAKRARSIAARNVHQELAQHYAQLTRQAS